MTVYTAQTYTDPSTLNSDPGDPVTSELAKAALFNMRAVAQGASGADTMEQAWHFLAGHGSTSDTAADIDFGAIDVTDYRALMVIGGFNSNVGGGAGFADWRVDVDFATAGWTQAASVTASAESSVGWLIITNADSADDDGGSPVAGLRLPIVHFTYAQSSGTNWKSATYSGGVTSYLAPIDVQDQKIVGVRVNPGSNVYQGSTGGATEFALYGIRRAQP